MLSYWPCQRLNVVMLAWQQQPAPPPLLARGAHTGPPIGFNCFLFLLVGVVLNHGLQIAGMVRCEIVRSAPWEVLNSGHIALCPKMGGLGRFQQN